MKWHGWWSNHYCMLSTGLAGPKPTDAPDYEFVAEVEATTLAKARSKLLKILQSRPK